VGPKRGPASSPPSLKARAIGYLSRREYSRVELRGRLISELSRPKPTVADRSVGPRAGTRSDSASSVHLEPDAHAIASVDPAAEVDALLDWLEAHGYLSDARFVESRLHARTARHGTLRIRQELSRHGLELDAEQVAALRGTEFERAKAVWERKFGAVAADARSRAAQARFLSGRGFSGEVVRRIVGGDDEA
jgi:regulatory protein